MDARFTDEQELLRASARALLERECSIAQVRAGFEDASFVDRVWNAMAAAGFTALPFAEELGGAGLGLVESVVLCEEVGRALAPSTWLSSALLGGGAIDAAGDASQRARWIPGLASGRARAALALLEGVERWDEAAIQLAAKPDAAGYVLDGTKRFVLDAEHADWIVVAARGPGGAVLAGVIDARAAGVAITPVATIDPTRRVADVTLRAVTLSRDAVLPGGWPALARTLDRAKVALAAELLGGADAALERTLAFARTREQFGQPIGSFQAIQHACADCLVGIESARSATWAAAWAIDAGEPDAPVAAAIAKALASDAFAATAARAIQIHGGQGFTWEQDPHLFYKRAKLGERLLGDAAWNREIVARALVDAPVAGLR